VPGNACCHSASEERERGGQCSGWLGGCRARGATPTLTNNAAQVDGSIVSRIGQGWLCLVGVTNDDTEEDADFV
jgi:hypothetical protein